MVNKIVKKLLEAATFALTLVLVTLGVNWLVKTLNQGWLTKTMAAAFSLLPEYSVGLIVAVLVTIPIYEMVKSKWGLIR